MWIKQAAIWRISITLAIGTVAKLQNIKKNLKKNKILHSLSFLLMSELARIRKLSAKAVRHYLTLNFTRAMATMGWQKI